MNDLQINKNIAAMATHAISDSKCSEQMNSSLGSASNLSPPITKDRKSRKKKRRSKRRKWLKETSFSVANSEKALSDRWMSKRCELNTPSSRAVVPVHSGMFQQWLETSGLIGQSFIKDLVYGSAHFPEWMQAYMTQLALPSVNIGYKQSEGFVFDALPVILNRNSTKHYSQLSFNELLKKVLEIPRDHYIVPDQETLSWQSRSIKNHCIEHAGEPGSSYVPGLTYAHIAEAMKCLINPELSPKKERKRLNCAMVKFKQAKDASITFSKYSLRIILGQHHLNKMITGQTCCDVSDIVKFVDSNLCFTDFAGMTTLNTFFYLGRIPGYESKGDIKKVIEMHRALMHNHEFDRFFNPVCFSMTDYLLLVKAKNEQVDKIFDENDWNTVPVMLINGYIYMSKFQLDEGNRAGTMSDEWENRLNYLKGLLVTKSFSIRKAQHVLQLVLTFLRIFELLTKEKEPRLTNYRASKFRVKELLINATNKRFPDDYNWLNCLGHALYAMILSRQAKQYPQLRRINNYEIANNYKQAARGGFVTHWGDAAKHYADSGFWDEAVHAAKCMVECCEDELMKLHWEARVQSYQCTVDTKTTIPDIDPEPIMKESAAGQKPLLDSSPDSLQSSAIEGIVPTNAPLLEKNKALQEIGTYPVTLAGGKKKKSGVKMRKRREKNSTAQHTVRPDVMVTKKGNDISGNASAGTTRHTRAITKLTPTSQAHKIISGKHGKRSFVKLDIVIKFVSKNKKNILDAGRIFIEDMDEDHDHGSGGMSVKKTEWKIVSHKNKIIDLKNMHMRKNWNPAVFTFLTNVNRARMDFDFQGEIECANALLRKLGVASMIGIERCFEEIAWTLLHIFDDLFNSLTFFNLYNTTEIKEKLTILRIIKIMLLSSIARYTGMDTININISFIELKNIIVINVDKNRNITNADRNQAIFRLSCLLRSMGHYHSTSAFLSPSNNNKHKDNGLLYYNYGKHLREKADRQFNKKQ